MPLLDQGLTYRCGPYSALGWFLAYGYHPEHTDAWTAAIGLADRQQGIAYSQEIDVVDTFAAATNARRGNVRYLHSFDDVNAALAAGDCVVVGLWLGYLRPGWPYYHYVAIEGSSLDDFDIKDTLSAYDGEDGHPSKAQLEAAISQGWDAAIYGVAWHLEPAQ